VCVRAAGHGDMTAILALAPGLAEGVAPWRDQAEAREAGKRWLADSLGAAARGDGAVFVAVGAAPRTSVDGTAAGQPASRARAGARLPAAPESAPVPRAGRSLA
jgi:hypothetical protein